KLDSSSSPSAPGGPLGAGVARYVEEQLRGVKALGEHAQHLGAEVAQADAKMEQHLAQKFVHQVGALAAQATATTPNQPSAPARSPMAQELLNMLSRPGGVRQAVVASEILRRPEERWA